MSRPQGVRHRAIDHHDFRAVLDVGRAERAAGQHPYTDGREVIIVHDAAGDRNFPAAIRELCLNLVIGLQRQASQRYRFHSGKGGNIFMHLRVQFLSLRFRSAFMWTHPYPDKISPGHANIRVAKIVQAALAESHAHQPESACRDLGNHESIAANVLARPSHGDFAAQHLRKIR